MPAPRPQHKNIRTRSRYLTLDLGESRKPGRLSAGAPGQPGRSAVVGQPPVSPALGGRLGLTRAARVVRGHRRLLLPLGGLGRATVQRLPEPPLNGRVVDGLDDQRAGGGPVGQGGAGWRPSAAGGAGGAPVGDHLPQRPPPQELGIGVARPGSGQPGVRRPTGGQRGEQVDLHRVRQAVEQVGQLRPGPAAQVAGQVGAEPRARVAPVVRVGQVIGYQWAPPAPAGLGDGGGGGPARPARRGRRCGAGHAGRVGGRGSGRARPGG